MHLAQVKFFFGGYALVSDRRFPWQHGAVSSRENTGSPSNRESGVDGCSGQRSSLRRSLHVLYILVPWWGLGCLLLPPKYIYIYNISIYIYNIYIYINPRAEGTSGSPECRPPASSSSTPPPGELSPAAHSQV